jgi:hypothetical protein
LRKLDVGKIRFGCHIVLTLFGLFFIIGIDIRSIRGENGCGWARLGLTIGIARRTRRDIWSVQLFKNILPVEQYPILRIYRERSSRGVIGFVIFEDLAIPVHIKGLFLFSLFRRRSIRV